MSRVTITEARAHLASIIDDVRVAPVYLTRRNQTVAAVVEAGHLEQLLEDSEELADIRAVDAAWEETASGGEAAVPWDEVKLDLGLSR